MHSYVCLSNFEIRFYLCVLDFEIVLCEVEYSLDFEIWFCLCTGFWHEVVCGHPILKLNFIYVYRILKSNFIYM